ncbi:MULTISPECIES: hypothetical protein [unclassified Nocardioides]|jgi:hypothetical protein|uniref:hypothetical protein n=1 Tax=unclassified Nocardioides TaxID=2615069 RepID=UPI0007039C9C|nr:MULTISPECIES: hypothetical protein [unclassified Nocardioides]KRC46413.1 hypothetical protein ASE19_21525 [Nocardioides sp. Root79]KRC69758.1 hypothetical protein ASE20_14385 [Nocardioides sp. Root240]
MSPARDALDRWIASGGQWDVVAEQGDRVTVALCTCGGGEEMDRVVLDRAELPILDQRPAPPGRPL